MIPSDHVIYAKNATLSVTAKNDLRKLYFIGYNISSLDVKIRITYNHIEKPIHSENQMSNIGPVVHCI